MSEKKKQPLETVTGAVLSLLLCCCDLSMGQRVGPAGKPCEEDLGILQWDLWGSTASTAVPSFPSPGQEDLRLEMQILDLLDGGTGLGCCGGAAGGAVPQGSLKPSVMQDPPLLYLEVSVCSVKGAEL